MTLYKFGNRTQSFDHFEQTPNTAYSTTLIGISVTYFFLFVLSVLLNSAIILTILLSKRVGTKGFNIYLIFLLLPEVIVGTFALIHSVLTYDLGSYPFSEVSCVTGVFVYCGYMFANIWTNALVATELYILITNSLQGRASVVSTSKIVIKCLIVYAASMMMAILYIWNNPLTELRLNPESCFPESGNKAGRLVFSIIIPGVTLILPDIYVLYITRQVYEKLNMTSSGNLNFLVSYFFRITFVMALFSLVCMIAIALSTVGMLDLTLLFVSVHGLLLAIMTMRKKDIRLAFLELLVRTRTEGRTATCPTTQIINTEEEI